MANTTITDLSPKTALVDNDVIIIDDSEDLVSTVPQSKKVTVSSLKDSLGVTALLAASTGLYENAIINGDFTVNQYGAFDGQTLANAIYGIDRFKCSHNVASSPTIRISTNKFGLLAKSTETNKILKIIQVVESVNIERIRGLCTLSAIITSNSPDAKLQYTDNTQTVSSANHTGDGNPQLLSVTFTISGSQVGNVDIGFGIINGNTTINVSSFDCEDLQLTNSAELLTFKPKLPSINVIECQEYAEGESSTTTTAYIGNGIASGSTSLSIMVEFKNEKRGVTTSLIMTPSDFAISGVGAVTSINIASSQSSKKVVVLNVGVASGLTAGNTYRMETSGSGKKYLFSSEI